MSVDLKKKTVLLICLLASLAALLVALDAQKEPLQRPISSNAPPQEPKVHAFQISQTDWSGGPAEADDPVQDTGNQFSDSKNIDYKSQAGSIYLILDKPK